MREGWEYKKIDECTEIEYGTRVVQKRDGGNLYPVFGGGGETFRMDSFNREDCLIVSRFAMSRLCVRYVSGKFFLNDSGLSVKAGKGLNQGYLNHFLLFLNDDIYNLGKGAAQRNLDVLAFKKLVMAIPPISKQLSIASELDMITELISKYDEQLKELDKLSLSIFYEMFGDPVENEKGWEVKCLGKLCDIVRGGSPRPIQNYLGGNIPWIKIGDATKEDDIYLFSTKEHINKEGLSKTRLIPKGSLIFANCGVSLGFARIITFDGCIHDGWLALQRVNMQFINIIFLLKTLNMCTEYFRKLAPEGTQPNLNTTIMKNFVQILPPLPLQQSFARKIEAIEAMKSKVKEAKKEAETLLAARMQYWFE